MSNENKHFTDGLFNGDKLRNVLDGFLEDPYRAEYYGNAPSFGCRMYIAYQCYHSEYEDEVSAAGMDRVLSHLDTTEVNWLLKYSGHDPERGRLEQRIRQLQKSGPRYSDITYCKPQLAAIYWKADEQDPDYVVVAEVDRRMGCKIEDYIDYMWGDPFPD